MRAEAEGFRSLARTAIVRVGSTTTVNIQLPLGILRQVVEDLDGGVDETRTRDLRRDRPETILYKVVPSDH